MSERHNLESIRGSIQACLHELHAHSAFYLNVTANTHGLDSFERMVLGHARKMMLDYLACSPDQSSPDDAVRFSVDFFLHAVSATMVDWLRSDSPMDPRAFADLCVANLPSSLLPYFG